MAKRKCDYKVRFRSKEDAEMALDSYCKAVVLTISPIGIYECQYHKCWHLGHSKTLEERRQLHMSMNWWKY
jgi:hypothetical protein